MKCRRSFLWFNAPVKSVLGAPWKTTLTVVLADWKMPPSSLLGEERTSPERQLSAGPEHHLHASKDFFAVGADFCYNQPHKH